MTAEPLDEKKIEQLILNGNYEDAAEELFVIIERQSALNSELVYRCLTLLNYICDKSPAISLRAVKDIQGIINEPNSWIRLVALEILYQISIYRPNLLIDLIDQIRVRFYDQEPLVRRLAVKIIGSLILSLHIDKEDLHEIIEEFTEKLMDGDWKVKLQVIKTLKRILNQDFSKIKDLEPLLSIVIVNLRDDDEDVARSAAELLKILSTYFLSKEKIMYVLLNLLYNEEPRVKELIIWLFGEIGKEKSSEIIPIIPKLINLLSEDDYKIQSRVIDALVNISENNFDQIWANLISSLESRDEEFRNVLVNALYHLAQTNITEIFEYIFEELENPYENVRKGIALVFKRLYEEYQVEIENQITKILYKLESKYWRERKKTILLLKNISYILEIEKVAVWIYIELETHLVNETDPDVRNEIISTLKSVKNRFKDIELTIKRINSQLELFTNKIKEFQKVPAQFREKMNAYLKEFRFSETEIELNKNYRKHLKKIRNFNRKLNRFEYKRLAFNLLEDWEDAKIQVIDELSLIKGFISEICEEKKQEFTIDLKSRIKIFEDKINILRVQYDDLKDYNFPDNIDQILFTNKQDEELEEKFTQLTQLRNHLFKLDDEIRDLIINNLEFDIFKDLLSIWVATKIDIQEYLSNLDRKIKELKDGIIDYFVDIQKREGLDETKLNEITQELGFQLFQGHIQTIISQGIEGFKRFNDAIPDWNVKVEKLIKKNEFSDVKRFIEFNQKQIQNFIEDYDHQINNIFGRITDDNNIFNKYVRPYMTKFTASKELLISNLKIFSQKSMERLYLNQIKYYLEVMNPIKLDNLATYMDLEVEILANLILRFINENKLNGKITNGKLHSPKIEDLLESRDLFFFKNIKRIGNKIILNFRLSNPTNLNFKDLQISLKNPPNLTFSRKESFPKYLYLNELKSSGEFKFNYTLKINKTSIKRTTDRSVDEITLTLFYKDPFNVPRKIVKKIDLLLP